MRTLLVLLFSKDQFKLAMQLLNSQILSKPNLLYAILSQFLFRLNKEAKKFRVQNVNEIDLKSNSDISSLLKSSIRSKPQNLLRKKKTDHLTKVHIFEQEFQKSPRIDDLGNILL